MDEIQYVKSKNTGSIYDDRITCELSPHVCKVLAGELRNLSLKEKEDFDRMFRLAQISQSFWWLHEKHFNQAGD